jgi:hypothetical protein
VVHPACSPNSFTPVTFPTLHQQYEPPVPKIARNSN